MMAESHIWIFTVKSCHSCGLLNFACVFLALCTSCKRESREFRPEAIESQVVEVKPLTEFRAGGPASEPEKLLSALPGWPPAKYEESAYAISQGKLLFSEFNCYGCHAHGGGD